MHYIKVLMIIVAISATILVSRVATAQITSDASIIVTQVYLPLVTNENDVVETSTATDSSVATIHIYLPLINNTSSETSLDTDLVYGAGSGSTYILKDGHTFAVSYGSTNKDDYTDYVNYIQTDVTVPGLRNWDQVCSVAYIYSQGQQVYKSSQQCKQYGPGTSASSQQWEVYRPSDPNKRVQIRLGQNEIKIEYTYTYWGFLNKYDCVNGMCGTAKVSISICPLKSKGDADCNNKVDLVDFEQWRKEYMGTLNTKKADFNGNGRVDIVDFEIWRTNHS